MTIYGSYSNGVKWRVKGKGNPKEYTCKMCGNYMKGSDNCFPGTCTPCRKSLPDPVSSWHANTK